MIVALLVHALVSLLPVLVFLDVLRRIDAHQLVPRSSVLALLASGGVVAVVAYFVNGAVLGFLGIDKETYSRYVAPVIEESLKASVLLWLFARNRIGFMVDAAIAGFAVGAGFSVVENLYYVTTLRDPELGVWIVRGFGTAIMHGGATASFAVLGESLTDRQPHFRPALYLPGLLLASVLHAAFNHFTDSPLLATLATLVVFPCTLLLVFAKSEHEIRDWLLKDYESHEQLLAGLARGDNAAGRIVGDLARRFDAARVADMFAYLKLHTELVLRAEKLLLAREGGVDARLQQDDREDFARLHALERRIGRTAMLALWPHLNFSRQELWQLYALEYEAFPDLAEKADREGLHRLSRVRAQLRRLRWRLRPLVFRSRRTTLALHRWLRRKMRRAVR